MSQLKMSVGIPAYNQGAYLRETLDSLLHQTVAPYEIVISNHFSTDNTAEVIAEYVAKHPDLIRGVTPPEGSGISDQWNYTMNQLTGDWITLFSSDDVARPMFVETFLRGAERVPDAVLVRAAWENITAESKVVTKEYLLSVDKVTRPPQTILEQRHSPRVSFAAYAVKREAFHASGGFLPGFESLGDWMFFLQIAAYGAFVYENTIVSGYRLHEGDKFRARLAKWIRDEMRVFEEVMPRAAAHAQMTDTAWIAEAYRANYERYLISASEKLQPAERKEVEPLFATWAARVGGEAMLARFVAGEKLTRPKTILSRLKQWVRPAVQKTYALLRS